MKRKKSGAAPRREEPVTMPLLRIVSLGCAKNFVDTELAAASLLCAGFGLTPDEEEADLIFINTCAFLKAAREEAEEVIRSAEEWKRLAPGERKIIVAGCIVSWDKDNAFRNAHPEVDAWTGIDSVSEIGTIAAKVWNGEECGETLRTKDYLYTHETPRLQLTQSHFAYLKVADGCDNCCTYCMIPSIRGSLRSRTTESVLAEARSLLKNGVKELILIAQDTSAFGRERNHGVPRLAELLGALDQLPGTFLLRLMYLHPASMDDALIREMAACRHLVRCIEMPLQHISDPILNAMHRKISEEATRSVVRKLKEAGFSIRTTFMLGFPGESEEDYKTLKHFVEETCFTRLGVFCYSREEGVPAAEFPNQVPAEIAERRKDEIMRLQSEISLAFNRSLIGQTVDVILDEVQGRGKACGRTFMDAPEIDNTVLVSGLGKQHRNGDFVKVLIDSASEYELRGRIAEAAGNK